MEHRPYPKIAFSMVKGRGADLARVERALATSDKLDASVAWVATEKIHGAQFVVATDGATVAFGKRKGWLVAGEAFFGWQHLRRDLERAARDIHRALGSRSVVRLYGELFGGAYPHPAVPAVKGSSPVQTGVWYAPGIQFALFDILVDDEGEGRFLAPGEVTRVATVSGVLVPPLLHRGSRAEVDALPVRFPTRVPFGFRLPALADNFAEGLVIKPDVESRPADRVVFKRKLAEFDETRLEQSAPVDKDPAMDLGALTAFGRQLVNGPRFDSARSKLGEGPPQALVEEVILDVLVDLEAAFPRAMRDLSPASRAALRKELGQRATRWLTEQAG